MSDAELVMMPRLSDSMEEGTILAWLKVVGEEVAVGDDLVEIETDKANMSYQSDLAGTLQELLAQAGDTAAVGAPIARIGRHGGASPVRRLASASVDGVRVRASPLARRLAHEHGIDLAGVSGSGFGGRIVKADLEGAIQPASHPANVVPTVGQPSRRSNVASRQSSAETAKGESKHLELSRLQQIVARRMAEAKATVPHFYLTTDIDMDKAVAARAAMQTESPDAAPTPSINDMVLKACAIVLREHPKANGTYRDGRFELHGRVNIGIAVAAQEALVVPTLFDVDRLGLAEIARKSRELAAKVRDGSIAPPELSGGTFTVSNLGMYGVSAFSAVINPPQACILAVGAIRDAPVVRHGQLTVGKLMSVTLSCDHRILYGADGAMFLQRLKSVLEEPLALAL